MELPKDRIEILVDVGVIELEIVEYQGAWAVVNELRPLVKEGRVVFIGFDNKAVTAAVAGILEYPGQQARRRRLAMSSGYGEDVPAAQYVFRQPLRPGLVRDVTVEHFLDDVESPANHVSDDDAVRRRLQLLRIETLVDVDAELFELRAHRRIDACVAAGYFMAGRRSQCGDAAHEGATDAEYVYVHAGTQDAGETAVENAYCKMNTAIAITRPTYHSRLIVRAMMCPLTWTDQNNNR